MTYLHQMNLAGIKFSLGQRWKNIQQQKRAATIKYKSELSPQDNSASMIKWNSSKRYSKK